MSKCKHPQEIIEKFAYKSQIYITNVKSHTYVAHKRLQSNVNDKNVKQNCLVLTFCFAAMD